MDELEELEWQPETLQQARADEAPLTLVDVRSQEERELVQLEDDHWVPMAKLPAALEEMKQEPKPLILYCHHGVRSLQAARFFRQNGLEQAYSLAGGIDTWARQINEELPTY